jgi:hypothetical protein
MGQLDTTIIIFTTDNGAQTQTFPDGGITPFKANKLTTWEGGMRVPLVIRWPGHIKPGTMKTEIFASLDWLPTLVEIAGGPKGNDLNKQIQEGKYPGIVKTKLDGMNQIDYLTGKSEKSARDTFFYYTGATPSAVRYKNWKIYFTMEGSTGASALMGPPTVGPRSKTSSEIPSSRRLATSRSQCCRSAVRLLPPAPRISTTGICSRPGNNCGCRSSRPTSNSRRCRTRKATTSFKSWNR